jgi:hypothetical protein
MGESPYLHHNKQLLKGDNIMFEYLFTSIQKLSNGMSNFVDLIITEEMDVVEVCAEINSAHLVKLFVPLDQVEQATDSLEQLRAKLNSHHDFDDWNGRISTFDTSGVNVGVLMHRDASGGISLSHLDELITSSSQS